MSQIILILINFILIGLSIMFYSQSSKCSVTRVLSWSIVDDESIRRRMEC